MINVNKFLICAKFNIIFYYINFVFAGIYGKQYFRATFKF